MTQSAEVVVVGGANMDVKARSATAVVAATSNPGTVTLSPGGVGRNIAENLARLGTRTHLVASLGPDPLGDELLAATAAAGVGVEHVCRSARATGTYTAILDADGELVVAVADMAATDELGPAHVETARALIAGADLVVLDGNLATPTLAHALALAVDAGVRVVLEPVSVPKAARLVGVVSAGQGLFAITPNRDELGALTGLGVDTDAEVLAAVSALHACGVVHVWVRLGRAGSLLSGPDGVARIAAAAAVVEDVTGAGDAMVAAFTHAVLRGDAPVDAAAYAHRAAALTVASTHTVRPDLTDDLVGRHP